MINIAVRQRVMIPIVVILKIFILKRFKIKQDAAGLLRR